jgi:hypothetical protein
MKHVVTCIIVCACKESVHGHHIVFAICYYMIGGRGGRPGHVEGGQFTGGE